MTQDEFFGMARQMLARDEGYKLNLYRCPAGKLTVGIGHNIEDRGLTSTVIDLIFEEDLADAVKSASHIFGEVFDSFSTIRKLAIVNLIFNLGETKFREFEKTIAFIRAGRWKEASIELLDSRYARQVGIRANRIAIMLDEERFPYK